MNKLVEYYRFPTKPCLSLFLLIFCASFLGVQDAEAQTSNAVIRSYAAARLSKTDQALQTNAIEVFNVSRSGAPISICQSETNVVTVTFAHFTSPDLANVFCEMADPEDPEAVHPACEEYPSRDPAVTVLSEKDYTLEATIDGVPVDYIRAHTSRWEYLINPNTDAVSLTCDTLFANADYPRSPGDQCSGTSFIIDLTDLSLGTHTLFTDPSHSLDALDTSGPATRSITVLDC